MYVLVIRRTRRRGGSETFLGDSRYLGVWLTARATLTSRRGVTVGSDSLNMLTFLCSSELLRVVRLPGTVSPPS
jgi:hypothetical protein